MLIRLPALAALATVCLAASAWTPPPGFTATRGGDAGRIIEVTTLAAAGPGSLAAALTAEGPRKIVFSVGGVIDLDGKTLRIRAPHVTVAGGTAPSPGITLIRGGLGISTHDVILHHLRHRSHRKSLHQQQRPQSALQGRRPRFRRQQSHPQSKRLRHQLRPRASGAQGRWKNNRQRERGGRLPGSRVEITAHAPPKPFYRSTLRTRRSIMSQNVFSALRSLRAVWFCLAFVSLPAATLTTAGDRFLLDGQPFKMWGVRTASASQNAAATAHLLAQLDDYLRHGLNTVTVFYQGSSGGYSNPFSADGAAIDPAHHARMVEIIEACDRRDMAVVVGIYYQRSDFPKTAAAFEAVVRTATLALRPYRNVVINLANEQNSRLYADSNVIFDLGDPARLIQLCDLVHSEDPRRLVGAGGYDHEKNILLGKSRSVDVLLFDTNGPEDSGALFDRFVAAGVKSKPIVNVEQFGAYSAKPDFPKTPGAFSAANRALFLREIEAASTRPALHTFFFDVRWLQGAGYGSVNRYDFGGDGTEASPGWRWYAEAVRATAMAGAAR